MHLVLHPGLFFTVHFFLPPPLNPIHTRDEHATNREKVGAIIIFVFACLTGSENEYVNSGNKYESGYCKKQIQVNTKGTPLNSYKRHTPN